VLDLRGSGAQGWELEVASWELHVESWESGALKS
jgi:hypothetical protein